MSLEQDPFIIIKSGKPVQKTFQPPKGRYSKRPQMWTLEEQKQYLKFLSLNLNFFTKKESNKQDKIFVKMTSYIPTRSRTQIKSHHQKMMKRHRTLLKAIQAIEEKINKKSMENDHLPQNQATSQEFEFPQLNCYLEGYQSNQVRLKIDFEEDQLYQKECAILFWDIQSSVRFEQHD